VCAQVTCIPVDDTIVTVRHTDDCYASGVPTRTGARLITLSGVHAAPMLDSAADAMVANVGKARVHVTEQTAL
jgi:hypothetical protein